MKTTIIEIGKPTAKNPKPKNRFRVLIQLKGNKGQNDEMKSFTIHDYTGRSNANSIKNKIVKSLGA